MITDVVQRWRGGRATYCRAEVGAQDRRPTWACPGAYLRALELAEEACITASRKAYRRVCVDLAAQAGRMIEGVRR